MLTRSQLRALSLPDLTRRADAKLRAAAERHGWRPMRATGIDRAFLAELCVGTPFAAESWAPFEDQRGVPPLRPPR